VNAPLSDDERRRLRHDLRTPLTIVTGFAEVLAGEKPVSEEDRRDYARRIQDAAVELRTLVDRLLAG
jgi:signal transduction histidine kinase